MTSNVRGVSKRRKNSTRHEKVFRIEKSNEDYSIKGTIVSFYAFKPLHLTKENNGLAMTEVKRRCIPSENEKENGVSISGPQIMKRL